MTHLQRMQIIRFTRRIVTLAKREALLRRVLARGEGSHVEQAELRQVLKSRGEAIANLDQTSPGETLVSLASQGKL